MTRVSWLLVSLLASIIDPHTIASVSAIVDNDEKDDRSVFPPTNGKYDPSKYSNEQKDAILELAQSIREAGDGIDWDNVRRIYEDVTSHSSSASSSDEEIPADDDVMGDDESEELWQPRTVVSSHGMKKNEAKEIAIRDDRRKYYGDYDYGYNNNEYSGGANRPIVLRLRGSSGNNDDSGNTVDGDKNLGSANKSTNSNGSAIQDRKLQAGMYSYGQGVCPEKGQTGLECPPDGLAAMCDKYNENKSVKSFKKCFEACKKSFCCIHSTKHDKAKSCSKDENCPLYNYCYIVWWKFHDTVGPAPYLLIAQDDDFFDLKSYQNLVGNFDENDEFNRQLLFHHFPNADFYDEGKKNGKFDTRLIFDLPEYWKDGKKGPP